MTHKESDLQTRICKWLKKTYPGLIFFSDFAAGLYFKEDWIKNLRSMQSCDDKYLDLTIMAPNKDYTALVIEIKVSNTDLFLKDGRTLKSDHVQQQYNSILKLRENSYFADFCCGDDDIKNMVKNYFNNTIKIKDVLPFRGTSHQLKSDKAADIFFQNVGFNEI